MHPILFHVGSFPVRSFGVMLMIGFVVAILLASKRAKQNGLTEQIVQDGAIWIIVTGVLFARILFIVQEWPSYAGKWNEIFKLQMDGLTSFGGLLGGALGILVFAKIKKFKPVQLLDTVGVPMLVASAIGRVGCLLNGCCYGFACASSPPGVTIYEANGQIHRDLAGHSYFLPAQLVDSALVLIGAWLIVRMESRGRVHPGIPISLTLVAYGLARFVYEFFRAGSSSTTIGNSGITEGHIAALALALVGAGTALAISRRAKRQDRPDV